MIIKDKVKYAREAVKDALNVVLSIIMEPCYSKGERIEQTVDFCKDTVKEINEKKSISKQ